MEGKVNVIEDSMHLLMKTPVNREDCDERTG